MHFEREIDSRAYDIYDLTDDEIGYRQEACPSVSEPQCCKVLGGTFIT